MKCVSQSENETARIAAEFARTLEAPALVCLSGDLGMGKSVFARALVRALCGDPDLEVPSPTFTLVQDYESAKGPVYHLDLYRLGAPEEMFELGWEEMIHDGIVVVEWPEMLGLLLPGQRIDVRIESGTNGPDSRIIEVKGGL